MPDIVKAGIVVPELFTLNLLTPFVMTLTVFAGSILKPVSVPDVKINEGRVAAPPVALICKVPDRVPPVKGKLREASPVKEAVIVPAAKLPEPSRATILLNVFDEVASTLIVISSALFVTKP